MNRNECILVGIRFADLRQNGNSANSSWRESMIDFVNAVITSSFSLASATR